MRLIDADALKEALSDKNLITWTHEYGDAIPLDWLMSAIDNAPTVSFMISPDYVTELQNRNKELIKQLEETKRPQGEWITGGKDVTGQYFYDEFICNQCFVVVTDKSNFCPKCGADMRKGGAV